MKTVRKNNWIKIRKELYRQLERDVTRRLGRTSVGLTRYKEAYDKAFSSRWRVVESDQFFSSLKKSQIILLGDFHALHQSQKSHLRILRRLVQETPLVLAVEFVDACDQDVLDSFYNDNINETQFLEKIKWQEKWGFPWEHYRPILEWAKKEKVPVFGVNQTMKSRTAATLVKRDEFSAQLIADICHAYDESTVVVIYGDLHLADEHLPQKIIQNSFLITEKNLCRVYQNSEILYFKMMELGIDAQTDILESPGNQFCLMSVAPWVKWQNYLLYLEQILEAEVLFESGRSELRKSNDQFEDEDFEFEEEDDDYDDDYDYDEVAIDFTDQVVKFAQLIAEDLKLKVSVDSLEVYSLKDASLQDKLQEHYSADEMEILKSLMVDKKSFYLPDLQFGILIRPTVNGAAQLAMSFLLSQHLKDQRTLFFEVNDFEKLIWRECLIYLGSKMINPRQKTDTLQDLQASIQLKSSPEALREAMQLALSQKMRELLRGAGVEKVLPLFVPSQKYTYIVSAQLLGRMMGEKVFYGFQLGKITSQVLKKLVELELRSDDFSELYIKIVKKIDSLPAPFKSKKDRL